LSSNRLVERTLDYRLEARNPNMTVADFRRIALSLEGAEEGSHMGAVDFRVGGRIFATLAHAKRGYGNLMLTPETQAAFVAELPAVFVPIAGGWGRLGATHILLSASDEEILRGALTTAWRLRLEANAGSGKRRVRPARKTVRSRPEKTTPKQR
jgi:hypothetical protein